MATSTIKRRLAAVSSLYGSLVIRGDAGVVTNPVPRGLPTRRNRHRGEVGAPLVRGVRRLPRILNPDEVEALIAALLPEAEMRRGVSHDPALRSWMFSATERLFMDEVLATVALPAVDPIWAPPRLTGNRLAAYY